MRTSLLVFLVLFCSSITFAADQPNNEINKQNLSFFLREKIKNTASAFTCAFCFSVAVSNLGAACCTSILVSYSSVTLPSDSTRSSINPVLTIKCKKNPRRTLLLGVSVILGNFGLFKENNPGKHIIIASVLGSTLGTFIGELLCDTQAIQKIAKRLFGSKS